MKRIKRITVLILFAVMLLSGCQSRDGLPALTDEKKQEIETAFGWQPDGWFDAETRYWGHRYYGSDNGYDILFVGGQMAVSTTKYIAGQGFTYGTAFQLYAYKDGEVVDLEQAYTDGLVSQSAIEQAAQYHITCEKAAAEHRRSS